MDLRDIQASIIQFSNDPIIVYDNELNTVYVNPSAYKMTGYSEEDVGIQITPELTYDWETALKVRSLMRTAMAQGTASGDIELTTKDGRKINVTQNFFAIVGEDGAKKGVGVIMSNPSNPNGDKKQDSDNGSSDFDNTKKMTETFKDILDQLDAYVYVSDMETDEILFVNKNMKELFDGDITGRICWQSIQKGMTERCPFCPNYQLEKDPKTPVEWEEINTVNGRCYRNVDSLIEWFDGRKVHMQYAIDITEEKQAQKETDNMLGVLKNILNNIDACVYVADMETDEILFINRRMQGVFGLDESAVGQICWKVLQSGFEEKCSFCPGKQLEENPDATVVWEEHNTVTGQHYKNVDSAIEWLNGKKVHLQHSTDVTDILEAQKAVQDSRERLEIALTASRAGVWEMDYINHVLSYDKLSGELYDMDSDKECMSFDDFYAHLKTRMPEETVSPMVANLQEGKIKGKETMIDFHLFLPTGENRHIRNFGRAIWGEDGMLLRLIGMSIDITKSVKMEEELKAAKTAAENQGRLEADERTQTMLDATPLAASLWDRDGNMLDCNMECVRLFGLKEKSEYIEHFYELNPEFQPDGEMTSEKAAREISKAFVTGHRKFEWLYLTKSGEELPVETTLVRVPWKGDYRIAAYSRDLREIRAVEKARSEAMQRSAEMEVEAKIARAASEAKSQFLSNMSHEIRTPMNSIIGMADLLTNEVLNERQQSYVRDIKISATSLLGIINDILDFSKIEAGSFQLVQVDYNIKQLLANIESMFMFAAQGKGITFNMNVLDKLPTFLYGDDVRVRQVLLNIIGNAIKFTREGGVTLNVRTDEQKIYFDISDTGIGIKEEDIPSIFNDFTQVDMKNNRNINGAGLGLSITKNLITMMEGSISVESEYGHGTSFYVEIPLVVGNAVHQTLDSEECHPFYAPDANILVVDDNEMNLHVATGLLGIPKIANDAVMSGAAAIQKIESKKYDIVFMDHMMPEMDGVEATRILREKYGKDELVIIALTANAIEGTKEMLLQAGMNDYLSKPIDKVKFCQILRKWLPADKIQEIDEDDTPKAQEELSMVLQQVDGIADIDVNLGLERIAGQQDIYEQSLRILIRRMPEVVERLESFLQNDDLKGFSIEVHGLKGSLNNIGATYLAQKAEALEMHSKDSDYDFCAEYLPELIDDLVRINKRLAEIIDENEADEVAREPGDKGVLLKRLVLVRNMLDTFEADDALEALDELACFDYGDEINNRLRSIIRLTEEFEYEQAMGLIDLLGLGGAKN